MGSDATEEIMRATYRALCEHGYADLTMQDIADESSLSKAALHYHYDSKQALLGAFQDLGSERFLERLTAADDPDADPRERLASILDAALTPPEAEDFRDIQTALLELRAQAPYVPAYRERLLESDADFRSLIASVVADGIEAGVFESDVDPEATARFIVTILEGHQVRHVSIDQSREAARELLRSHVEEHLTSDRERPTE